MLTHPRQQILIMNQLSGRPENGGFRAGLAKTGTTDALNLVEPDGRSRLTGYTRKTAVDPDSKNSKWHFVSVEVSNDKSE